jgi:hypothetical protein
MLALHNAGWLCWDLLILALLGSSHFSLAKKMVKLGCLVSCLIYHNLSHIRLDKLDMCLVYSHSYNKNISFPA